MNIIRRLHIVTQDPVHWARWCIGSLSLSTERTQSLFWRSAFLRALTEEVCEGCGAGERHQKKIRIKKKHQKKVGASKKHIPAHQKKSGRIKKKLMLFGTPGGSEKHQKNFFDAFHSLRTPKKHQKIFFDAFHGGACWVLCALFAPGSKRLDLVFIRPASQECHVILRKLGADHRL